MTGIKRIPPIYSIDKSDTINIAENPQSLTNTNVPARGLSSESEYDDDLRVRAAPVAAGGEEPEYVDRRNQLNASSPFAMLFQSAK